jgi:hypothetical protein
MGILKESNRNNETDFVAYFLAKMNINKQYRPTCRAISIRVFYFNTHTGLSLPLPKGEGSKEIFHGRRDIIPFI